MQVERGGLWGKPATDPAVRRAAFEQEVKLVIVRARNAATGPKKDSLYDATSAAAKRKPLSSAFRFADDMITARTPLVHLEQYAHLLVRYVRQRHADEQLKWAA